MIRCESCRRAELTPFQRAYEYALDLVIGPTPAQRVQQVAEMGSAMMRVAMGGAVTPYERHRDEFIRTGEPEELERMLRHVKRET